jgi:hypothetical protein
VPTKLMANEERILQLITDKGITSIQVFNKTKEAFDNIKLVLQQMERDLKSKLPAIDPRIPVEYDDKRRLEVHFKIATDVLVFIMHPTVFTFELSHSIYKSSYVKEDPLRASCCMIYIYNFLADSVKYNRGEDIGTLVARLFVNKENHFFVDGKKQVGLLFNDFANDVLDNEKLQKFIQSLTLFVLEADVNVPSFDVFERTTLRELTDNSSQIAFVTGKHFGFTIPGSNDSE